MSFKKIVDKYEYTSCDEESNSPLENNPFITYQDMIDGQINYYEYEDYSSVNDPEKCDEKMNENELEENEDDVDTINIIDDLYKYCKMLSRSQKKLIKEVYELKQEVARLNMKLEESS